MGFCSNGQTATQQNSWQDPLGPASMGKNGKAVFSPTGAPEMRSQIFDYLKQYQPGMAQQGQDTAAAFQHAATDPGWVQAQDLARRTMSGDYLHGSPELTAALDANARTQRAGAADANARIRSTFTGNGMGFSTGNQQAQQNNEAQTEANIANTNAQTYLQNYQAERANQNAAPQTLATATGTPLNYLSQESAAQLAPLERIGSLVSALSSGGSIFGTGSTGTSTPSTGASILSGVSAL